MAEQVTADAACKASDEMVSALEGQVVALAGKLGVLHSLGRKAASVAELRAEFDLGQRGADALLTCLVALGLLKRDGERYATTAAAATMIDAEVMAKSAAYLARATPYADALVSSVKQDQPIFPERVASWERGDSLPDEQAAAQRMHALTSAAAERAAQHACFNNVKRLLDVAGGKGTFVTALAERHDTMELGLFELPGVCEEARAFLTLRGLDQRVALHPGDLFRTPLPRDYEVIYFSNVFHDWSDEVCTSLAREAFAALPPGGRIFLHEMLLNDDRSGPRTVALFSFMMLLTTRGRQFTAQELCTLLTEVGFERPQVIPSAGYFSLIVADRP